MYKCRLILIMANMGKLEYHCSGSVDAQGEGGMGEGVRESIED